MNLKAIGIGIMTLVLGFSAKAQDVHFSQYYYAPMNLNPAMTGVFSGKYRMGLNYRDQWGNINDAYNFSSFFADAKFKSLGLGISGLNESSGGGTYYRNNINGNISIDFAPKDAANHFILGVQAGMFQHGVDGSKIETQSGTPIPSESSADLSIGIGALWFNGRGENAMMPFIGASVYNVNGTQESFEDPEDVMSIRSVVHGGIRIHAGQGFDITPHGQLMVQAGARNVTGGVNLSYALNNLGNYLMAGASYRVNDAFIPFAGLRLGNLTAGVSYDFVTGSLSDNVSDASTLELSIQYIIPNKKYETRYICPRL